MKVEFKEGKVVIDGIETSIPEEYWKSPGVEKYRRIYRKASELVRKLEKEEGIG